jgi:hypothetical protein
MRAFHTSAVELRQPFRAEVLGEPYECAWADEAIFFVTVADEGADFTRIRLRAQISPDGVHWVDEGTDLPLVTSPGLVAAKLRHFGGWLRVAGTIEGGAQRAVLTIHLVLKG